MDSTLLQAFSINALLADEYSCGSPLYIVSSQSKIARRRPHFEVIHAIGKLRRLSSRFVCFARQGRLFKFFFTANTVSLSPNEQV